MSCNFQTSEHRKVNAVLIVCPEFSSVRDITLGFVCLVGKVHGATDPMSRIMKYRHLIL